MNDIARTSANLQAQLKVLADKMTENYYKNSPEGDYSVTFEFGKKYIKVIKTFYSSTSVAGFIVNTHNDSLFPYGTLLKAASWKMPARNFGRGNVFELDGRTVPWTGFL